MRSYLEAPPNMRLRPFVASSIIVLVVIASHTAEASAILFNDRGQFDAALNGDFQSPTIFNRTGLSDIAYSNDGTHPGVWFGGFIGYHAYFYNPFMTTPSVTAIGFDYVNRTTFSDTGPVPPPFLGVPFYDPNGPIPDLLFTFKTAGGFNHTSIVPLGSFLGVMLLDEVFSDLKWETNANCGFCISLFVLDNLAVQTVPEPATALLVLVGAMVLLQRRRFTRPK